MSILWLDGLAKRYGILPSEALNRCNTFDLYIMDCAMSFEHYHHQKSTNKNFVPDYTQEELQNMLNLSKGNWQ